MAGKQELLNIVSKTVQRVEEGGEFRVAGRKVSIRKATDPILKFVMFAKDFITSAVSAEPHAALAWAGICVFLPVGLQSLLLDGSRLLNMMLAPFKLYNSA